jgi:hypothetical protein
MSTISESPVRRWMLAVRSVANRPRAQRFMRLYAAKLVGVCLLKWRSVQSLCLSPTLAAHLRC